MYKNKIIEGIEISEIRKIALYASEFPDILNLSIGEPEPDIPESVKDKMIEAIRKGVGYSPAGGIKQLREIYADFYNKKYKSNYTYKECIVTVGASESFSSFFRTIIEEDDEVIVTVPAYPGYIPAIKMLKAKPVLVNTKDNGYEITADLIEKHITDKTKLIVLTSPNNPTGKIIKKEQMDKIVSLLLKHNIYLLSDEIYSELCFNNKFESFAQYTNLKDRIVITTGLSKSHSMTGYRVGITLSSEFNVMQALKVSQYTVTSTCTISQLGAVEAIKNHSNRLEIAKKYGKRTEYLVKELTQIGFDCVIPDGGFYVYANYSKITNKKSLDLVMDMIDKARIAIVPGSAFLDEYAVRICVNKDQSGLEEFILRLKKYLKETK